MRLEQIQYSKKHLIWSFSLPLLIILGMLIFQLSEAAKHRCYKQFESERNKKIEALFSDKKHNAELLKKYQTIVHLTDSLTSVESKDSLVNNLISHQVLEIMAYIYQKDSSKKPLAESDMTPSNTRTLYIKKGKKADIHHALLDSNIVKVLKGEISINNIFNTYNWEEQFKNFETLSYLLISLEKQYFLPSYKNEKEFNTGVIKCQSYLCKISPQKVITGREIYAMNSDTVRYIKYQNSSGYNAAAMKLHLDLTNNVKRNILKAFGFEALNYNNDYL